MKNKTIKNVLVGFVSQAILLVLGLIIPRIVLVNYGSDTNGLTNTIGQVFTYVALLEAGISVSARNAFYNPIKNGNRAGISFVASLAKKYYKRVSAVYFVIVVAVSFILPIILRTDVPYWTVMVYILFEGMSSVIVFFFINTWTTFLRANGSSYVIDSIYLAGRILCYIVKIILSMKSINIAFIQIGYFAVSLIQVLLYYLYMKKKYAWLCLNVDTGDKKLPDKNANLISEVSWVVFSSTDMIVLSVFISTALASVYSIYNMVFMAVHALLNAVYGAVNYHLGLEYNGGNKEGYTRLHDLYMSVFVGAIALLMSVTYWLINPFVELYTKNVSDIVYIRKWLPLLFCLIQLLSWSRYVTGNLIGITFRQRKAVKVNVTEAIMNLSLSILLVRYMGIEGVLLATVLALPIKVVYCTFISDVVILERSIGKTVRILLPNYALFLLFAFIRNRIGLDITSFGAFILYGIILIIPCTVLFLLVNCVANKELLLLVKDIFHMRKKHQVISEE